LLASILGTEAALIGEFIDSGRTKMRTLAVWYDGRQLQNFDYDVAHSPCRYIVGRASRFVAAGVNAEFAPGTLFATQGFDAYAGYSLFDANDEQVGLIVALSRRPLADRDLAEALMKIFAVRAAAELERRRAAEALQISETSYRAIFQAVQDAIFVHDWDTGAIVDVNPRACEVYGYTREELLSASLAGLGSNVPPYTLQEALRHIDAAKAGRTVRFEWHRRNKDGSLHWDEVMIQPVHLGGVRRILAVTREITERKRTEQVLRDSESLYRGLFNASADAMVLRDPDFRVVDVNPSYTTMSGYSREETIGADRLLTVGEAENEQWRAAHLRTLAGEQLRFEFAARRKDGTPYEAEVRGMPVTWNDRPHVLYVTRDITERKQAERALAASEEQYRGVFNASADALVLWNSELRVVDVNPAYLRIYRQRREDVVGFGYPAHYPREYVEKRQRLIRRALAGETCELQTQSYRPDGELFEVEWRVVPVLHRGEPHALAIARDITERKRAEQALASSEEQYRGIFNASADALVLWNSELRIVDVNPAYLRIYGFTREQVVGTGYPADLPAEYVAERLQLVRRALEGEACELQTQAYRANGERFEVDLRVIPIMHRGIPHVLAIARDITERKAAEAALRASEEQYRAIFNASADALILWDSSYRRVDVNPAYERTYGWTRAEVIGRGYEHPQFPAEYIRPRHELVRRALAGEGCSAELEAIRKDGKRLLTEVHAIPFRHRGEPHVLAIARDITERKVAEAALRASEEQYRAIFAASADAMVLRDEQMRVVDVNPAFLALVQRPREEIVGRVHPAFVIAPEREAAEDLLRSALAGRPGKLEVKTVGADGVTREVEVRAAPMQYQGRPHVLAIARDVTAERRAERESRRLETQLRQAQKMEAIGQLTGGIAHDFNNILASVMGYVVLAEERASDREDAKAVEYLGQALASCRRARDLIQQMLTFSRGGRGEPRAVDLGMLVRDTTPMLRASLPSTLQLVQQCDEQAPPVWIDEIQAHQVLLNLAINARDAMAGAGVVRIGVHLRDASGAVCSSCRHTLAGEYVELSVADRGGGIAPELIERIFDPFFTTKAPGKGSGMGLSTVHGIVHEYGGHVVVDSAPGEGSVFRVLWPATTAAAPSSAAATAAPRRRARLSGQVLLIDDEAAVLGSMREMMSRWGLRVEAHAHAESALASYEATPERFDVVVTDLAMPNFSGLHLAARVRARRRLPVLLCSGFVDERGLAAARRLGLAAVLHKPVEAEQLHAALEAALANGARGEEARC
jgi:PAS domain S-box-containing protein